ncbi:WD40 repeat-like protein [Rhizopogon vinicolor AM-OR11-026]|uniref:WD40 repeat-like protein n=1 Tax=Rhizopogon vinicolor AM-OR11-026 TaxID=1314800 RepID=A0A1B7N3N8_9AGAM|nr:WD40 repeat-like protein [Rhizopogon vinicolor AM-OR11-026]
MKEETEHPIIRISTPVRVFDNRGEVVEVAVFPDRRRMATNSKDGMLRLWDLKSGVMVKELEGRGEAMRGMALSRNGELIASSDESGYVNAWHGDTGRALTQAFRAHTSVCSLDFSPDGATLATGGHDCTVVKLWNTETWKLQGEQMSCDHQVNCVRYSPSGELLAIATIYTVDIRNTATKQRVVNLNIQSVVSLVWIPNGARLLSGNTIIQEWDPLTWPGNPVDPNIWKGQTGDHWRFAVNWDGTVVASPTTHNHVRLWRLSDRRTIAIFQHSDSPSCVTFSMDGKYVITGGQDKKISVWAVPEHAWPEDVPKDEAKNQIQDSDTGTQNSDTEAPDSDIEVQGSETKILAMNTKVRKACISGDLPTAEELLTQETNVSSDNYRSYANRSVVMARKLDWDHALNDATKSLSIQHSLMGYISKGIALCGKKRVRDARDAFDLASTFTDGDPKTIHFLFLIKSIALFSANQHGEAMRRVRQLAAACPDADTTLACRVVEVYLHIQLGNNALDRACATEAADHFTTAANTAAFLSGKAIDSKYEEFVVLFGCDFTSLWQTANQKRCHALLRAGKLAEVLEAYRYMANMSDESMKASCLNWSIGFMQELSTFRDHVPNADATPDIMMCKYDEYENDSISDIDSDIDHVDDVVT